MNGPVCAVSQGGGGAWRASGLLIQTVTRGPAEVPGTSNRLKMSSGQDDRVEEMNTALSK